MKFAAGVSANGRYKQTVAVHWAPHLYKFLEANVAGYMTRTVTSVSRDMTMAELKELFKRDDYNAYPVVEDGQAIGLVTKYDFWRCFAFAPVHMVPHYDELMNKTVGDVMTPDFIYVHPEIKLTRVLQLMVDHQTRSILWCWTTIVSCSASSHAGGCDPRSSADCTQH
ncbi:MAG: CBS domain-containing protein [Rhodopseudomonas palustris]|nr:CBS domain-containing protein [Rhodopseudomonas palustris]